MDGIVYAASAGLGFASVENAFFLATEGDPRLICVRGFTTTIAHVMFLAPAGFFLVRAKLGMGRWRRELATLAVVLAVLLHGSYDWILIHVGFAMSKISAKDAEEQMRLLAMLGEEQQAMQELEGYRFS